MIKTYVIDELKRTITPAEAEKYPSVVVGDDSINGIEFEFPTVFENFDLSAGVIHVVYIKTDGTEGGKLLTETNEETGRLLWKFDDGINKGKSGVVIFALVIDQVDEEATILKTWVSLEANFDVKKSLGTIRRDDADEEETYRERLALAETRIAALRRITSNLSSGTPIAATAKEDLKDPDKLYVATFSDDYYVAGDWYFNDGSDWISGGPYGGIPAGGVRSEGIADGAVTSDKLADDVRELINDSGLAFDGGYQDEEGFVHLTLNGEDIEGFDPFYVAGGSGGGGGSGNNAVLTLTNTSGWLAKTISASGDCVLAVDWSSIENEMPTGNGTLTVRVGGVPKMVADVEQGSVSIDVARFLTAGSNKIRVTVSDIYGNTRSIAYTVTVVDLSVSSMFDASRAYSSDRTIVYTYTPIGAVEKMMHFVVDGEQAGTVSVSASNRQQSYKLPAMGHGAHSLLVYFTAEIEGSEVKSNELYYDLIVVDSESDATIIASPFRDSSVTQYTTIAIPYTIYNPKSLTSSADLYAGGEKVATLTVDRTEQLWSYRPDVVGELRLKIVAGGTERTFLLNVTESEIDAEAEVDALALHLTSYGRSNTEVSPAQWSYEDISATLANFNYKSDGWVKDENNVSVLRVSGDARVYIPYFVFGEDFRTTGKTIELEFATRTVMNYDSVILSCLSGGRGLFLTAQKVQMNSEQSEISMQFKENEHVRASFVVEKKSENRLIYCYINGIMSGTIQYPEDDDFSQTDPVGISIGSNDCTIDIYCIRVYDNDLTRAQILENWIADTQSVDDMLARYKRNQVYDAYGNIVREKLPQDLPYLILECDELPQYKGDKKTVSGSYTDPLHAEQCFTFTGAQFDVQGTSSQYYERKNYKAKYKKGFVMANGTTVDTFKIRDTSIPVSTFCYKADVASSEGANNVELVRLYDMACPYKTPAQQEDSRVRQGIDGFPIVIFWHDTVNDQIIFMGKYNWNNDKSTEETFGFQEEDESWEVRNNTSDRVLYKSADYTGDAWLGDFEARFPDTDPPYTDPEQLQEFAEWVVSTDTDKATGAALDAPVTYGDVTFDHDTAAYRLAKFKAEAGNYMELQSAMFYYLFTELFLMVDSRAKNMFPSFMGSPVT